MKRLKKTPNKENTLNILLLDFLDAEADSILDHLLQSGYEVKATRADAKEKGRGIRFHGIDLILADYDSGNFSHSNLIDWISKPGWDIPLLLLTDFSTVRTPELINPGTKDFLLKEEIDQLGNAIEKILLRKSCGDEIAPVVQDSILNNQRLNAIAEGTLVGLAIVDNEERFNYVNSAFTQMLGFTQDELLGMNLRDVILAEEYGRIDIQREKRRRGEADNYETVFKNKDGSLVYAVISASPLTSPEGEYIGAQAVVIDISQRVNAERDLMGSENLVRQMIDNSPLAFNATDMTGQVISCNQAMCDLLGYSEGELCQKNFNDFSHPEDHQRNDELYTKLVKGEIDQFDLEKRYVTKEGVNIDVSIRSQLVRDPDGRPLFEFAIVEDISEIKLAEIQNQHLKLILNTLLKINKLMTSEKDVSSLIQKACDLLTENRGYHNAWIMLQDDQGKFLECAESGLGEAFLPMKEALISGDLPVCARDAIEGRQVICINDPFQECLDCPLRGNHNDRAGIASALWTGNTVFGFLVVSIPKSFLESKEEQDLFQEVARDISLIIDHIQSKRQLAWNEDQLNLWSLALESASNAIVITGSDGLIQWANPAFTTLTGYPLEEVLGRNPSFLKSGEQDAAFYRELWKEISTGRVWQGEVTNKRANGELYIEEMTITPLIDDQNEIVNYIAIKQDITEKVRNRQKIIQRTEDLVLINEINNMIREGQDLEYIFNYLFENTSQLFASQGATVYLLDSNKQLLTMQGLPYQGPILKSIEDILGARIPEINMPVTADSFISKVIDEKQPRLIHDPEIIQSWMMDFTQAKGIPKKLREIGRDLIAKIFRLLRIQSIMIVPMISGDECIGIMDISSSNRFGEDDFQRFISLASQITAAIISATANRDRIHTENLLFSLSKSAPNIQRANSWKEIFRILSSEAKTLGFDVTVFMLNDEATRMTVSHNNFSDIEEKIKKMTGLSGEGYSFPITPGGFYHKLITGEDPVYSELEIDPIKEALPAAFQPAAPKIMKMIGNQQTIICQLVFNGRIQGLVAFSGFSLRESDIPALKTFVNQAAVAMEKTQLFQEMKDLAIFSSNIVDNIVEGIIIESPQGEITFANPVATKMLATPVDEMLGKQWQDILHPDSLCHFGESGNGDSQPETGYFEMDIDQGGRQQTILVGRSNYLNHNSDLAGKITVLSDINDLKRAERENLKQTRRLKALRIIDQTIIGSFDLDMSLNIILEQIIKLLNVDAATVLIYQPNLQELSLRVSRGFNTSALEIAELRMGEGFAGKVALSRKPILIPDLKKEPGEFTRSPLFGLERFITYYGLPLESKGKLIGVLEVYNRSRFVPDADWENFMNILAGQVAIAIENFSLYDDLQRSNIDLMLAYDATIEGWAHALELKDMETEGHSRRVVETTLELARRLSVSEDLLPHLRRGALLHDIGKMGIPDRILQKKGKLNDEEWGIMHQHPVHAYQWLSRISYLKPALDIPYAHHERWDGTGYPRKLKGDEIPIAARIFAIVDVWDALNSDRPYRKAWPKDKIIAHIESQSGKHFDPEVVREFLTLLADKYSDDKHWTDRFG